MAKYCTSTKWPSQVPLARNAEANVDVECLNQPSSKLLMYSLYSALSWVCRAKFFILDLQI